MSLCLSSCVSLSLSLSLVSSVLLVHLTHPVSWYECPCLVNFILTRVKRVNYLMHTVHCALCITNCLSGWFRCTLRSLALFLCLSFFLSQSIRLIHIHCVRWLDETKVNLCVSGIRVHRSTRQQTNGKIQWHRDTQVTEHRAHTHTYTQGTSDFTFPFACARLLLPLQLLWVNFVVVLVVLFICALTVSVCMSAFVVLPLLYQL